MDLHMSLILWTVSVFPKPQHFQLTIAKEDPELGGENPPVGLGCLIAVSLPVISLACALFVAIVVGPHLPSEMS